MASNKQVSTHVETREYSVSSIIKTSIRVICKLLFLAEDGVDTGSNKLRKINIESFNMDASK